MCSKSDAPGDAVLLASLASMPEWLTQMLAELDEEVTRRRPLPEDWCVVEAVAHLADVEPRYRARLERIKAEDNPQVPAIWPCAMPDPLPPLSEALANFSDERTKTVAFLSPLGLEAWERPAQHATLGATTLRKQVQGLIEHDESHLHQIAQAIELVERY